MTGGAKTTHEKPSSPPKTPESDDESVTLEGLSNVLPDVGGEGGFLTLEDISDMLSGIGGEGEEDDDEEVDEDQEADEVVDVEKEACEDEVAEEIDVGKNTELEEETDTDSNAPTPWPEGWYEGGMELGLSQFAGKVMAEFPVQDSSYPCDKDGEASHYTMEIHTAAQGTPGVSSSPSGSGSGSSTAGHSQASPSALTPPSGHSHKRSRARWDGEDDGAEDPRTPKRQQGGAPPGPTPIRGPFYACPFHKRYPEHSPLCGMPHGSKRDFGWDSVSRVK